MSVLSEGMYVGCIFYVCQTSPSQGRHFYLAITGRGVLSFKYIVSMSFTDCDAHNAHLNMSSIRLRSVILIRWDVSNIGSISIYTYICRCKFLYSKVGNDLWALLTGLRYLDGWSFMQAQGALRYCIVLLRVLRGYRSRVNVNVSPPLP